jgi:hypothetical protein
LSLTRVAAVDLEGSDPVGGGETLKLAIMMYGDHSGGPPCKQACVQDDQQKVHRTRLRPKWPSKNRIFGSPETAVSRVGWAASALFPPLNEIVSATRREALRRSRWMSGFASKANPFRPDGRHRPHLRKQRRNPRSPALRVPSCENSGRPVGRTLPWLNLQGEATRIRRRWRHQFTDISYHQGLGKPL